MKPDCVVGFLQLKRDHASVFVEIVAIGNIIRDTGELRDGGVFFLRNLNCSCGRR